MTIPEALEKLDQLQAQIIHGGTPFKDIADAIRQSMEWQPLDNSPRDGDVFMAYVPHDDPSVGGFQFCAVWNREDRLLCMMSGDDFTDKATLWRAAHPLPEREEKDPDGNVYIAPPESDLEPIKRNLEIHPENSQPTGR